MNKNATQVIKVMVSELGFDSNIQRVSDKCAPLHLAIWCNHPEVARLLISYGADQNLENSYGEPCVRQYEKLLKSGEYVSDADTIEVLLRNSHACNKHVGPGILSYC